MSLSKIEHTACTLCASSAHEVVSERDRRGAPLRTVLCGMCGHVFTNPIPNAEALAAYYRDAYRQDYKRVITPKRKHIYRAGIGALNRFSQLAPYVSKGARIIDIGAGGGEFVYLLTKNGFDAVGVEPHAGYSNYARETYGVDIMTMPLESTGLANEQADAVTLHHVLEHTAEPMDVLRRIWAWLKPGGLIAVEVPNLASWAHAPHHRFHRAHLQTFNRTGFVDALMNAGFDIVQINAPNDRGHLSAVARKVEPPVEQAWRNAVGESRTTLAAHTQLAHILAGQPLRRIHANLTRSLRERFAISTLGNSQSGRDLLDAIFTSHL